MGTLERLRRQRALQTTLLLGSFAFVSPAAATTLLFAAGGGGGAPWESTPGGNGVAGPTGADGGGAAGGAGGVGGFGGQGSSSDSGGGGGGGWYSAGGDGGDGAGGLSVPTFSGGVGFSFSGPPANGGFGGGGGGGLDGGGGGGGFSGGGGAGDETGGPTGGGGGGSFVAPAVTGAGIAPGSNGVNNAGNQAPGQNGFVYIGATLFSYSGSIVDYVIPATGDYYILAAGAQGGNGHNLVDSYGGYGAVVSGNIDLLAGTELEIIVGGAGVGDDGVVTLNSDGTIRYADLVSGGGGGGSFVAELSVPVVVAAPEPPVWALAATGFAALGFLHGKRRRRNAFGEPRRSLNL